MKLNQITSHVQTKKFNEKNLCHHVIKLNVIKLLLFLLLLLFLYIYGNNHICAPYNGYTSILTGHSILQPLLTVQQSE